MIYFILIWLVLSFVLNYYLHNGEKLGYADSYYAGYGSAIMALLVTIVIAVGYGFISDKFFSPIQRTTADIQLMPDGSCHLKTGVYNMKNMQFDIENCKMILREN